LLVTVIVAVPAFMAFTLPFSSTVATELSEDFHANFAEDPSEFFAENNVVSPTFIEETPDKETETSTGLVGSVLLCILS